MTPRSRRSSPARCPLPRDAAMPWLDDALKPVSASSRLRWNIPALQDTGSLVLEAGLLRHKRGRRALLAYRLEGAGPLRDLVGKSRARGLDIRAYRTQKALYARGFDGTDPDGISVPKPLGVVPEWRLWVQLREPGTPLETRVLHGSFPAAAQAIRKVARAAGRLHESGVPTARVHTMADELEILAEWLVRAGRVHPGMAHLLDRVFDAAVRLSRRIDRPGSTGVHRDFHPGQFLVSGERLVMMDLDLHAHGDPVLDHGNFLAHLTELALRHRGDPEALAGLEAAYREEVLSGPLDVPPPLLAGWHALSLARHVGISTARPGRSETTGPLAELVLERLEAAGAALARGPVSPRGPLPSDRRSGTVRTAPGGEWRKALAAAGLAIVTACLPLGDLQAQARHELTPGVDVATLYDSNVNRDAVDPRGLAGVVTTGILRHRWRGTTDIRTEYEIGVHQYNGDTPWNRISHKARLDARRPAGSWATAGLAAEFQVRGSGDDRSLGDQLSLEPSLRADLGPRTELRSRLISRFRWNREIADGAPVVRSESALLAATDLSHEIGDRTEVEMDLRYEWNRSETGRRDFQGPRVEIGVVRSLTERDELRVELEWRDRRYVSRTVEILGEDVLREDTRWTPRIVWERSFNRYLVTRVEYEFESRGSNDPDKRMGNHELIVGARVLR